MNRQDMLAGLISQTLGQTLGQNAAGQPAKGSSDLVTLRAIVEEASEMGADRAMSRLGLGDADAQGDIDELRELLQAWRDAKTSASKAAIQWIVRGVLALLLIGIAVRIGVPEMLR